jgi:hypothetical protein
MYNAAIFRVGTSGFLVFEREAQFLNEASTYRHVRNAILGIVVH